jgi:hypothetical protein
MSGMNGKSWIVTLVSKEWQYSCSGTWSVVVTEFCNGWVVYPIWVINFSFVINLETLCYIPSKMSFTQAYGSILLPFIQNYKDAKNEKAWNGVVETATNAILNHRNLLEEQGLDLPQNLKAVCPTTLLFSFHWQG